MSNGYLWRLPKANATTLKNLIAAVFPSTCWCFGGALLWDVNPENGRENLRPIEEMDASRVNINGDFGHAFAEHAEVRWKRRDAGDYDVLLLAETLDTQILTSYGLSEIACFTTVVDMAGDAALMLNTPREVQEQGVHCRLGYKEYHAGNGVTQFARYVHYREEPVKENR
jgi:hypothetical protein